jgi:hypothetical protein
METSNMKPGLRRARNCLVTAGIDIEGRAKLHALPLSNTYKGTTYPVTRSHPATTPHRTEPLQTPHSKNSSVSGLTRR